MSTNNTKVTLRYPTMLFKFVILLLALSLCFSAKSIDDEYDENMKFDCYPERGRVDSCREVDFKLNNANSIDINSPYSPMIDRIGNNIEGESFYEWEIKNESEFQQTEALDGIFTEYGYAASVNNKYNEFTPNMTLWEKKYNAKRLTRILSDKSSQLNSNDGMTKMKNFKYFALTQIEHFRGATNNFSDLKWKTPKKMLIEVFPKELNFNSIELCSPMYKNFTLKNLDKQKNIEIASIIPESSQIIIEHDFGKNILIRPGNKINIRVTVTAEIREPIKTVIVFTLKNGYKLVYLVKFIGIDNYYGLEPLIVDKARHPTNMIDFFMTNQMNENFDFTLSDIKIKKESSPVELYHAQYKLGMSESDNIMDRNTNNPHWYEKFSASKIKIGKKLRKPIFKMNINDTGSDFQEFVVQFMLKDLNTGEKRLFAVPVYIYFNNNAVDLYPPILDFGVLYANSGIKHTITIKAVKNGLDGIRVGFPFVTKNQHFEYDFSPILDTHGVASYENHYTVGKITLKTLGLTDGDHSGYLIFCKDKFCDKDKGKTRIYYQFKVHKDPLNGVSKIHSFEVSEDNTKSKEDKVHIQLLWIKNTFNFPLRIDDVT